MRRGEIHLVEGFPIPGLRIHRMGIRMAESLSRKRKCHWRYQLQQRNSSVSGRTSRYSVCPTELAALKKVNQEKRSIKNENPHPRCSLSRFISASEDDLWTKQLLQQNPIVDGFFERWHLDLAFLLFLVSSRHFNAGDSSLETSSVSLSLLLFPVTVNP